MIPTLALLTVAAITSEIAKLAVFFCMISTLILLHEYGHFCIARRTGVHVTDFALGIGPKIVSWRSPRSQTTYRLNLFPIGGYCAMQSEDNKSSDVAPAAGHHIPSDSYPSKTPWQRLAIVVAGPAMNFVVALVLLLASYAGVGVPTPTGTLGALQIGEPAAKAGLHMGDTIIAVNGVPVDGPQLITVVQNSTGKPLQITYTEAGTTHNTLITPIAGPNGHGRIGFRIVEASRRMPIAPALTASWSMFSAVFSSTLGALGGLISTPSTTAGHLQGIIGIASVSGQVQDAGWGAYLSFAAMISISLGLFNLLPIPALDGGRAIFILAELVRGKPVDPKKEALVHAGGMLALFVIMIAVSFHDIANLFSAKSPL